MAHLLVAEKEEPSTFSKATQSYKAAYWREAMQQEINASDKNEVWELVEIPKSHINVMNNRWVYQIKRDVKGNIIRHKARLVAKGCAQKKYRSRYIYEPTRRF